MRRWILPTLVLVLAGTPAWATDELHEQSRREWDASGLSGLAVRNPRGLITLKPGPEGRVRLVAMKIVRHGNASEASELARATRVEAKRADGRLELKVVYPQRREIHIGFRDLVHGVDIAQVEVRLAFEIPAGWSAELHTASGDLETMGLTAPQRLESVSGDVSVIDAGGSLTIQTSSGDAHLEDVRAASVRTASGDIDVSAARGPLVLTTGSGDVEVDSAGDSLRVSSGSGEVRVGIARRGLVASSGSGDVTARVAGRVIVETGTGDADVTLLSPLASTDVHSQSGDVTLRLPTPADGMLEADSQSGSLDVRVPIHSSRSSPHHVTGTLGRGGKARVVVRTTSGSAIVSS